jgi:aspartokinase/homoserine dehydrogenase 1
MSIKVLKFGGTSMGSAIAIQKVCEIIYQTESNLKVIVVSAMSGTTDNLLKAGKAAAIGDFEYIKILEKIKNIHEETVKCCSELSQLPAIMSNIILLLNEIESLCEGIFAVREFTLKTQDKLISYGELLSSIILKEILIQKKINCHWKDARELIVSDENYSAANVDFQKTNSNIQNFFNHKNGIYIIPGFIANASTDSHSYLTTTLGRGGSDYSASIIAAALQADMLEIWTDVSGMMTADPRFVPEAKIIPQVSYDDALELSHFGAKVIYPPTIQPVLIKNIPIAIKNTFSPNDYGTLISKEKTLSENGITGISAIQQIALITIQGAGMVGISGFAKRFFSALALGNINIILITQASSEHSITAAVNISDVEKSKKFLSQEFELEIYNQKIEDLIIEKELSIIAIVGENMRNQHNISGKFFSALGKNGVNIRAIAQGSSEKNISTVVQNKDVRKALQSAHQAFFESPLHTIHVFIFGVGNVGKKLLQQIMHQKNYLKTELHLEMKIIMIANSKQAIWNENGINLSNFFDETEVWQSFSTDQLIDKIIALNIENSVVVDNTANETIPNFYSLLLHKGTSVVTCNKIACSNDYQQYYELKRASKKYNTSFLFETNVGAGLPIISTLNDLIKSGDKILEINAVLSGTLNYIFNNYTTEKSFATIVKEAMHLGLSEPDPRIDLSGVDVMRKILILARETGEKINLKDVSSVSFLPKSAENTNTIEDFLNILETNESHFSQLYINAKKENKVLRFVAKYNIEKGASVALEAVHINHPFYNLMGKDNIITFTTMRYFEQPLVIKGAGAGADVTASGVFADILKTI